MFNFSVINSCTAYCLQCFDTIDWPSGRASGL